MMLMPSNNTGFVTGYLFGKFPNKIALLISPDGWRVPQFEMNYALDNGAFTGFKPDSFLRMIGKAELVKHKPLWVAVPDKVYDAEETLKRWHEWKDRVNFRKAFVVQDGMEPQDVPKDAYCVFVGGSDEFKMTAEKFLGVAKWLHIGRVNKDTLLKYWEKVGANSIDGTGWMRAKGKQYYDMIRWFEGDPQMELFN